MHRFSAFAIFTSLFALLFSSAEAIKWLGIEREWKSPFICPKSAQHRKVLGLSNAQVKFCRRTPALMRTIGEASASAVNTCQEVFSGHRWNCSSLKMAPALMADLTKGTREQAFVYALSAAAITQRVASVCASGQLSSCSCGNGEMSAKTLISGATASGDMNEIYKWKGCSDNVAYGKKVSQEWTNTSPNFNKRIAADHPKKTSSPIIVDLSTNSTNDQNSNYSLRRRWIDARRNRRRNIEDVTALREDVVQRYFMEFDIDGNHIGGSVGPKWRMNQHNNEVGRQLAEQSLYRRCKCHGVSSSCDVRTCWYTLPPLKVIAERLKEQYAVAQMIGIHADNEEYYKPDVKKLRSLSTKKPLVYMRKSADYCEGNLDMGSFGTQMRECNVSSSGPDGCESLCCGRGFNTRQIREEEHCECKYVHCCYVKCKKCTYEIDKHYCK